MFCFFFSVPAIWRLHLFKHACQIHSLISVSSQCRISCSRPTSPSRYNNHGAKVRGGRGAWKEPIRSHNNKTVFIGQRRETDAKPTVVQLLCNRGMAAGNSAGSSCSLPTRVDIPCDCQTPRARAPQIVFFSLLLLSSFVCFHGSFVRQMILAPTCFPDK